MPMQKREPFRPIEPPENLNPDEEVFFCPLTKEIFRAYEDFFNRIILLNSLVWTCSVTGRSGLTFEEALQSEQNARDSLNSFPEYLEKPLLFVATLTYRGRIDDLVSDVWTFMKDRYFLGEEVEVFTDSIRKVARILKINVAETSASGAQNSKSQDAQITGRKVKEELKAPSASRFTYDVQFMDESDSDSDSDEDEPNLGQIKENIPHSAVFRQKSNVTKAKLKLFLKNFCEVIEDRWAVKPRIVRNYYLNSAKWEEVFAGSLPQFPVTPMSKRMSSGFTQTKQAQEKEQKNEKIEKDTTKKKKKNKHKKQGPTKEEILKLEEERKREEEERRIKKLKEKQQEEVTCLLAQARQFGVEDLSKWERANKAETMMDCDEVLELRMVIKKGREERLFQPNNST